MKITTKSKAETEQIGLKLAKKVRGGDIFGLIGNLGTGKTCLTKGFAKGLGIRSSISSPTFILLKQYAVKKTAIKNFCHVDVYRLHTAQDIFDLGLLEYLKRKDTVTIIEWADKLIPLLTQFRTTFLTFSLINTTTREITITKKPPGKTIRG